MAASAAPAPSFSGPRKAAVLLVLLGEDAAGKLLQQLPQEDAARIAREVAELGPIAPDVAERVLSDYFADALKPREDRGGPEVARRILANARFPEDQLVYLLGRSRDETPVIPVLQPLLDAPPAALAAALGEEHPQTAALVLLNLPPFKASQVVRHLPEALQSETVLRMATLRRVKGEVLGDVASTLKDRLATAESDATETEDLGDTLARTASVLSSLKRPDIRRILDDLEASYPDEAVQLRGKVFTFDSLLSADDRGVQELLRQVESKTVAMALKGAEEGIVQKFLGNLSERAATMLKDEMEFLSNLRASDQENAQREIVNIALKLEAEEKLRFEETGEVRG